MHPLLLWHPRVLVLRWSLLVQGLLVLLLLLQAQWSP